MATATRADRLSEIIKKREVYSDLPVNLNPDPMTASLSKLTNEESIKRAIRNLILTEFGERFYQPEIGSRVRTLLFENASNGNFLLEKLDSEIRRTIEQKEPRVKLLDVQTKSWSDDYSLSVNIIFTIINRIEPINLDVILRRVR
jgi:phage baseplate assembly protein W